VRIFFVNLSAGGSGQVLNPRVYTVVPLIAAYLWVYERLRQSGSSSRFDRIAENTAACCGSIALAALLYFEAASEWVVIAWALMVMVLMAVAWILKRRLFLIQGLVFACVVFARALLYNLTAPAMPGASFWHDRVACIGISAAVLIFALPIAFRLRRRDEAVGSDGWMRWVKLVVARPEQLLFFAPLVLVTIMLAREMRAGMITITWSALGVGVFLVGLLVRERSYRLAGLGLLLLGVGKILFIDIWKLAPRDRYITLIVMGVALLLVSFLYTRYREKILKFL